MNKLITCTCDCGTVTRVPENIVGTHAFWKCTACIEAEHAEFAEMLRKKQSRINHSFDMLLTD